MIPQMEFHLDPNSLPDLSGYVYAYYPKNMSMAVNNILARPRSWKLLKESMPASLKIGQALNTGCSMHSIPTIPSIPSE